MRKNLLFIFALLLTAVTGAWADDSGSCGAVSYSYVESTHTLTISGTGAMADYVNDFGQPWYDYQDEITTVVIEDGVTSIGDYAFMDCSNLATVTFDGTPTLTTIGDFAFFNCYGLTSITIPAGVTSIGDRAFESCDGLTSITIPASVTSIGKSVFGRCSNLATMTVETENAVYDSRDGCNAIIKTSSNTLIAGCKGTTIPAGVTSIGDYAFTYCFGLTSITIPAGVTTIGDAAFYYCDGLTSITIPASVTSIGVDAFMECSNLATVTFDGTPTLTTIGDNAFAYCNGLTSITIPASVTSIGKSVFGRCSNLATMTVETENAVYDSRDGCNAIIEKSSNTLIAGCKGTTIPAGVTSIGDCAFESCYGLTSITIPAGVTTIGDYAFTYCSGLTSITIPASVTTIGEGAFSYCDGLTSITIPASVTSIGGSAFYLCDNLATVTLNSYPFIGYGAFDRIADGATVTMNLTGHEGETGEYWMTFYNDSYNFQADANTQVFKAALDEKSLTLTELAEDKIVQWDNAVILKSTSSSMVMTLTTTDSSNDFSNNWLCGVDDPAGLVGDGTIYVLGKGSGGVGFYKLETGSTLGYGKAYLEYDGASPSNFFGFEEGETTRVIQIENGKLKVENLNSGWYTLGGLKLQGEPTEKGVYIYNGKKVVK